MVKMLSVLAAAVVATSVLSPRIASAAPNLLVNPGLELASGYTPSNGNFYMVTSSSTAGPLGSAWTINGAIDIVSSHYWQVTEGSYSVDLIGSPGLGSISQTLTGLTVGNGYTLTFDMAVNPADYIPAGSTQLTGEASTTKRLQVSVTNPNNSVVASQIYTGTVAAGASKTNMGYGTQTFGFTATNSTETLNLAALLPLNMPTGEQASLVACGPVVDNLILTSDTGSGQSITIPEPASLGLMGAGSLLLLRRRRR